jgi:hypothetical protein
MAAGVFGAVALTRIDLGAPAMAVLLPAALFVGGAVMLWQFRRRDWKPTESVDAPVATLVCAYACMIVFGLPILERSRPASQIGRWIAKHASNSDAVALYRLDRFRATTRYYAARPIARIDDVESLRTFVMQPGRAYVVMLRDDFEQVRAAGIQISEVLARRAVVATSGKGLRRQHWGSIVIAAE